MALTIIPASSSSGNVTSLPMWEHANTVTQNYTMASGDNAISAGTVTINNGVSVTIPNGSSWVVV